MRVSVRYYFILTSINFQAYCNFTIFVAVIQFVISLFQFVRFLKFFYKGRDSTFLSAFVDVIVCAFMTIMTLTAALFVTLGFKVWCEVRYIHGLHWFTWIAEGSLLFRPKYEYVPEDTIQNVKTLIILIRGPRQCMF